MKIFKVKIIQCIVICTAKNVACQMCMQNVRVKQISYSKCNECTWVTQTIKVHYLLFRYIHTLNSTRGQDSITKIWLSSAAQVIQKAERALTKTLFSFSQVCKAFCLYKQNITLVKDRCEKKLMKLRANKNIWSKSQTMFTMGTVIFYLLTRERILKLQILNFHYLL